MITNIKVSDLVENKGQIDGVPKNPRFIKNDKFKKLVKSIQDNPEMLELRELLVYEYEGKYVVIGGNMRLSAAKELGFKKLPCKIIPQEATPEMLSAYIIKDNGDFGTWDYDKLNEEWDTLQLEDWGVPAWLDDDTSNENSLPNELKDLDISPDKLDDIKGSDETFYERIIIMYRLEEKERLSEMLKIDINKIIYNINELFPK